ncbi:MAG: MFS transporter, partial [Actinomycetota bacterium]
MRSLSTQERETATETAARPTLLTPTFLLVAVAELCYFTADGVLLPALPRFVEGPLGGGNIAVGIVVGAFSLTAFFLRPWAGALADRRGRRILMVVGASLFASSVVGYLFATSVPALVATRLLTGVGEALFFVAAVAANLDLAPPERRGEAMSLASLS